MFRRLNSEVEELVGAQGSSLTILSLFSHGKGLERVPDLPAVMLVNKAQFFLVSEPVLVSFHSTFENLKSKE